MRGVIIKRNSQIIEDLLNASERLQGELPKSAESLAQALQFWVNETKDFSYKMPELELRDAEADVLNFLGKLTVTAEYKNQTTRPFLAKRVVEVFTAMQADVELRDLATGIISIGLESCGDRVISALDQIELQMKLHAVKKMEVADEQVALTKLANGFLLLAMIQEKIQKLLLEFPELDEIGLHLALQIRLAKCCELPVSTTTMLFSGCVGVPVATIDKAVVEIVNECTDQRKEQFRTRWQPWMECTRAHEALPAYESLPEIAKAFSGDVCAISQEPTDKPVYYNHTLYDYDQFITLYRKTGKDPMNQDSSSNAINLQLLRRVIILDPTQ